MISVSYFKVIVHCCFILILVCVQLARSIVMSIFLFTSQTLMSQYNLRLLPPRDFAAMDGSDLNDNEEFHDSFDFPPAIVPPGTSNGNPASQSSTPLASNRGANGWKDEIAELNLAITKAKAEIADLVSSRGGKA